MSDPVILLVDNGSTRAASTLGLRSIAQQLSIESGREIFPVSLQHADKTPAAELGGRPADVLPGFLGDQLTKGCREFVLLPLFFGHSRALTSFIPQQIELLTQRFGAFELRQAAVLSPLPAGEPLLADIVADNLQHCIDEAGRPPDRVIVVDHGSPLPEVTAVREQLTEALKARLPSDLVLDQAVMERRAGVEYDFNGLLLKEQLDVGRPAGGHSLVILAMLFLLPGRHAGRCGDIDAICRNAETRHPGLEVRVSPLVGEHPLLIDILKTRLEGVL